MVIFGFLNANAVILLRYVYTCHAKRIHRLADDFLADFLLSTNLVLALYATVIEYIRFKATVAPYLCFCQGTDWSEYPAGDNEGVVHHLVFVTAILHFALVFRIYFALWKHDAVDNTNSMVTNAQAQIMAVEMHWFMM